jgi:hypothetical protein
MDASVWILNLYGHLRPRTTRACSWSSARHTEQAGMIGRSIIRRNSHARDERLRPAVTAAAGDCTGAGRAAQARRAGPAAGRW